METHLPVRGCRYFLGGHDLEMITIRDLIEQHTPGRWHDKELAWGAHASAYRDEIESSLVAGEVPVLVELDDDMGLADRGPSLPGAKPIFVDHHGSRAGKDQPTSLHQVFELLGLGRKLWTRWFDLVAANDRGYIPALREIGATDDQIVAVRAADRAAQGISAEQETQGEHALKTAQVLADGRLLLVSLPHDKTAVVSDPIAIRESQTGNSESLFVVGREALHFFGEGRLVVSLNDAFPGGWYGGALPDRGFWGHNAPVPGALSHLLDQLDPTGARREPQAAAADSR